MNHKNVFEGKVLVIGVNGQDGGYLAKKLLLKGYEVHGVGRQIGIHDSLAKSAVSYIQLDLSDLISYEKLLKRIRPNIIFYVAAVHGSFGFEYQKHWKESQLVNSVAVHATLEYIRAINTDAQLVYFSSSKVFGSLDRKVIDEKSQRVSNCIYTITKNSATDLIDYYRREFFLSVSVAWFFNHESPRREITYFIPTVVDILANALRDQKYQDTVYSLDFWCDWGCAEEYMTLLVDGITEIRGKDIVFASGVTLWARDVVAQLFRAHGLDYKNHIVTTITNEKDEDDKWRANIDFLCECVGRPPRNSIFDICEELLKTNYGINSQYR